MKSSKLTRLFSTAAVVGAFAMPAVAQEGDGIHIPGASASVSLDYVTQYFFRGFEQADSDQGVVLQPGAEFTIPVVEDVTATVGTWGSIHTDTATTTSGSNPRSWYEQDIYAYLEAVFGDVTASLGLTYYTYPSTTTNADITELNVAFSYDDSELLGDFAFAPYVALAFELQNNSVGAAGDENAYLELGGAFTIPTEGTVIEDWSWSVPFAFGLSIDNYYVDASGEDEFFGYFQVGLEGSIALAELIGYDEWFGAWDLTTGVYFLILNSDVALTDNADDTSDNFQVYALVGISRDW